MLPKFLSSFLAGVGVVLMMGAALAPVAQTDLTTDQQLQLTLASVIQVNRDQDAEIAALYATIDAPNIATAVATITQSETPHASPTRTPSPSATRTPVIAAPTVTNTPQGTAPTPTLDEVPMEPTIEDASTPPEGDLVQFYGNATSQNVNIRACAGTSCPVVGTLPEHGSLGLCAGSAQIVGAYEFWQIATEIGASQRWIAVRNVDNGALLMASLDHEQISTDTNCGE